MPNLTDEQIEKRRHGIGSSEIAQALGLSHDKRRTAYALWLDKRGEGEEFEQTEEQAMGHLLEPIVAQLYEAENEATVTPVLDTFVHPEYPWLMATPDYRVVGEPAILECKTRSVWFKKEFGEPGSDEIPMGILTQCLAQLAVMQPLVGVNRVDVGVLFGGNEYLQFMVHYDKAAVDRLIERVGDFWQHVQSGTPPAPQSLADVRRMFSRDVGRVVEASPAVADAVEKLRSVRETLKKFEESEEFLLLAIQTHMADASTLVLPDGQIAATWKKAKDSQRLDTERLKAEYFDVYTQCLKTSEGSRRFLLK